jgi:hypothetical protein
MRLLVRVALMAVIVVGAAAGSAQAVTVKELLDYKGRLSDDVLIALIESDGSVFHLTAADVMSLVDQGLSERVVTAMLRTATAVRTAPPLLSPPRDVVAAPARVVQDVPPPETSTPAPVVVNVNQTVTQQVHEREVRTVAVPVAVPVYVPIATGPARQKAPAPVYWGFGGQRRPDTWKESPAPTPPGGKPVTGTGGGGGQTD